MSEIKLKQVATMKGGVWDKIHESARRVYDPEGLAPTIHTCGGGNLEPKIVAVRGPEASILGSLQKNAAKNFDGICPTLTEAMGMGGGQVPIHNYGCLIRKLTPRECFRLMGFTDTDFDKVKFYSKKESEAVLKQYPNHKGKRQFTHEQRIERMSDSQCYKQAGNSIVVTVLEAIFKEMIGD